MTTDSVQARGEEEVMDAKEIGTLLREHQPITGMQVASGVTCKCGYWTGIEQPGVTRPPGYSGLQWHQAEVIAASLVAHDAVVRAAQAEAQREVIEWFAQYHRDWDAAPITGIAEARQHYGLEPAHD